MKVSRFTIIPALVYDHAANICRAYICKRIFHVVFVECVELPSLLVRTIDCGPRSGIYLRRIVQVKGSPGGKRQKMRRRSSNAYLFTPVDIPVDWI
jgi:hypothetical protein